MKKFETIVSMIHSLIWFKIPSGYAKIYSKPLGTSMATFITDGADITTSGLQLTQVGTKEVVINDRYLEQGIRIGEGLPNTLRED